MPRSRRVVLLYYAFRITHSAGFYLPVAILILRDKGFGLDFVGLSYAVFSFATVAVELPTGYVGDRLGRRGALALGATLRAAVMLAYPFAGAGVTILALHVVWAAARSFYSGTADAWLYEVLTAYHDESAFARIEGRGSSAVLVTSAVGAVVGGVLYTVNPALPFGVNAALALAGLPVLAAFPAVQAGSDDPFTLREAVAVLKLQTTRPAVCWLVVYAALFDAVYLITRIYEQPALRAVHVPVAGLGVLYAGFKLVSAAAASRAGWLQDRLGARGVFGLLVPVYAVVYGAIAVAPVLVVPALFLNRSVRTVARPVRNQYLNDRLADVGRATVLSGAAMVTALAGGLARVLAGPLSVQTGAVMLLPVVGVTAAALGGGVWLAVSPVRDGAGLSPDGPTATGAD